MDVPRSQRTCELLPYLAGVSGWIKYRNCWDDSDPLWQTIDRHHVFRNRSSCDEPWNIVLACRPVHQFVQEAWQQAGQVVCMIALHRAGRLDPRAMSANIKPDPLWQVENWLDNERLFDREPMLKLYSMELLDYYGRAA